MFVWMEQINVNMVLRVALICKIIRSFLSDSSYPLLWHKLIATPRNLQPSVTRLHYKIEARAQPLAEATQTPDGSHKCCTREMHALKIENPPQSARRIGSRSLFPNAYRLKNLKTTDAIHDTTHADQESASHRRRKNHPVPADLQTNSPTA